MDVGSGPAESRLERLIGRLLAAAEASLAAGDHEPARAIVEEVRAVSPDDHRAVDLLARIVRGQPAPGGERALMTMLFADLANSTALAERVEPEVMRDILAAYRDTAGRSVEMFGGQVLQWLGDGVLAVFGHHRVFEDDARRGVSAALALVETWTGARSEMGSRFGVEPQVRAGVHTGVVVVAGVGDEITRGERDSIVGAAPNLAARIQGEATPDSVVISDVTHQLVDADFHARSLGLRDLKGVSRPVELFMVEGPRHPGARLDADRYRRTRLVGRDQPCARVVEAWDRVRTAADGESGSGLVVLIGGEAGIGKSRLAAEIRDRVTHSGGDTFEAGCLAYYVNIPLWPVARMMERVVGRGSSEPAELLADLVDHLQGLGLDVAEVLPFLAPLLGISEPDGYPTPELEPAALLDRTLQQLVAWLSRLPRNRPAFVLVEDLHWADPSTLELLDRVIEVSPLGLLVVLTTRHPEAFGWGDRVLNVPLDRLPAEAADSLVDELAGTSHLSEDIRTSIILRGEGIPLFIEELTRSALTTDGSDRLPLRVQELLTGRLKAPGLDLRVAQIAATVGPTFDLSTVVGVIDDRERVIASLDELATAGIIESTERQLDAAYRFRHALLRDAAYETQVLDVRIDTHARIAKVLRSAGADAALVAQHHDLADDPERAIPEYLTAGQGAQARGAHREAIRLLTRAVELAELLPERESRDVSLLTARLLRALSISATDGYADAGVRADHQEAEILTQRLGNRPEVLPALLATWVTWFTTGDLRTSRRLITRLLPMATEPSFSWFEPEAHACAGFQSLHEGDIPQARAHLERAIEGFDQRPNNQKVSWFWPLPHDPIAITKTGLASVSTLQGNSADTQLWEEAATRRAEEVGFPGRPISLAFVKVYGAWTRRMLGDDRAARTLGAEVAAIGQAHGSTYWEQLGSLYLAAPSLLDEPSSQFVEHTIVALQGMGHGLGIAGDLAYLTKLHARAGRLPEALETIDGAIRIVNDTGERLQLPELLRARAQYRGQLGSAEGSQADDLLEALQIAESQHSNLIAYRVANDIAALPPNVRPGNWQHLLEAAQGRLPTTRPQPEPTDNS